MKTLRLNSWRGLISITAAGSLLIAAGCELPPLDEGDFGQKTMDRHYQNGEMNAYGYQSGNQFFKPQPTAPTDTDAAKPATSGDTAKPAPPPAIKY